MLIFNKYIAAILLSVLFINCNKAENPDTSMNIVSKPVKVLALGDSYTKGQSVPRSQSFPYQLKDRLNQDGKVNVTDLQVIAETGWTTTNLITVLDTVKLQDTFDLVTLLIGVNNEYQHKPIALYETEFTQLLNSAINYAGGNKNRVAVISIPDYGATPFGMGEAEEIAKAIDEYNAINKRITDSAGITYLDITSISREAATDPSLTATDLLHPSGKMYKLWVDFMLPQIKQKVE